MGGGVQALSLKGQSNGLIKTEFYLTKELENLINMEMILGLMIKEALIML